MNRAEALEVAPRKGSVGLNTSVHTSGAHEDVAPRKGSVG